MPNSNFKKTCTTLRCEHRFESYNLPHLASPFCTDMNMPINALSDAYEHPFGTFCCNESHRCLGVITPNAKIVEKAY